MINLGHSFLAVGLAFLYCSFDLRKDQDDANICFRDTDAIMGKVTDMDEEMDE